MKLIWPASKNYFEYTISGKHLCWLLYLLLNTFTFKVAGQIKQWDKTYGGTKTYVPYDSSNPITHGSSLLQDMVPTPDGGYLLGGYSDSEKGGDKSEPGKGSIDYWVVKIDESGKKKWDKTIGGTEGDDLAALVATSDGYLLAGTSDSETGDDKSDALRGVADFWVVKLDTSGNKLWDRTFGGDKYDNLRAAVKTPDGGFLLGGTSSSAMSGDKHGGSRGSADYWIVRMDATGNPLWDQTYGGKGYDNLQTIVATSDGGYLLGGTSNSGISGDKQNRTRGKDDYWIVKITSTGIKQWDRTFGSSNVDNLQTIVKAAGGGYLLGGTSLSGSGGDKHGSSRGGADQWVIKIDENGQQLWDRTLGGSNNDELTDILPLSDGTFIIGGFSNSGISGQKSEVSQGGSDYWLLKVNNLGQKIWDKSFGGQQYDYLRSVVPAPGGYLLAGYSDSDKSGSKSESTKGFVDYWLVQVVLPPQITSFTPEQGLPGTTVTIKGNHLQFTRFVRFNGVKATYQVINNSYIKAVVPGSASSGYIEVETIAGKTTSSHLFTVVQPSILAMAPNEGAIGSTVLIMGTHLTTVKNVFFNGVPASNVKVYYGIFIKVTVPEKAVTGSVRILLTGGGQATSDLPFKVTSSAVSVAPAPPLASKSMVAESIQIVPTQVTTYPNPFSRSSSFGLTLAESAIVQISIYSEMGQKIYEIAPAKFLAGTYVLPWNGLTSQGQPTSSGLYYYHIAVNSKVYSGRLVKIDSSH
ncbi:IPT/TIG domain-containing protein [Adhaeribacter arboris]|nr:IPT/TIG domain-containing protein [Adhaeribacter arboris]